MAVGTGNSTDNVVEARGDNVIVSVALRSAASVKEMDTLYVVESCFV